MRERQGIVVQFQHVFRLNDACDSQDVLGREGGQGTHKPIWDACRKQPLRNMSLSNEATHDIGRRLRGRDMTVHVGFIDLYVVHQSPEFHPLTLNLSTFK